MGGGWKRSPLSRGTLRGGGERTYEPPARRFARPGDEATEREGGMIDTAKRALDDAGRARAAGEWHDVLRYAEDAAAAGADPVAVAELRAIALTHLRRLDDAESQFAALLGAAGYRQRGETGLGIVALERGDDVTARAWLERATAAGASADAWAALGLCLTRLGETAEAWRAYLAARTLDPGHRTALHGLITLADALERVGLTARASDRVAAYSSGMKQRLSLARILLNNPPVILLDEPTNGLDPPSAEIIRDFIVNELVKRQGRTVILASHNLTEVEKICDRIALIDHGRVTALGTADEIKSAFGKNNRYYLEIEAYDGESVKEIGGLKWVRNCVPAGRAGRFAVSVELGGGDDDLNSLISNIMRLKCGIKECFKRYPISCLHCH